LLQINAIDQHAAGFGDVEALEELGEGAFAGAAPPHHPHRGALRDIQGQVAQNFGAVEKIAETHAFEAHVALDRGKRGFTGVKRGLGFGVDDIAQPLYRQPHLLEVLPQLNHAQHWRNDAR